MVNSCKTTTYADTHKFNANVLTYLHLDVMATWLLNETIDLSQEYNLKIQHVLEQQKIINENENELVKVQDALQRLQAISCEIDHDIETIDNAVENCDQGLKQLSPDNCPTCPNTKMTTPDKCPAAPTEQEQFLKLLEQADAAIQNAKTIAMDLKEFQESKQPHPTPYKMIFQILNCHCEALNNTEKNLDLIMDKIGVIDELYRNIGCKCFDNKINKVQ